MQKQDLSRMVLKGCIEDKAQIRPHQHRYSNRKFNKLSASLFLERLKHLSKQRVQRRRGSQELKGLDTNLFLYLSNKQ